LFYLKRLKEITPISTHIKGVEMIHVSYRTAPEVIREVLPPPLEPGPDALAAVYVARFAETDFGSPAYLEGALFVQAKYKDVVGNYCLAMYVTDDIALVRGREVYGFPKKIGSIRLDGSGSSRKGTVERRGVVLLTVETEGGESLPVESCPSVFKEPTLLFKFFINPECTGYDYNPRLVSVSLKETPTRLEKCSASVTLGRSKVDPLHRVRVEEIVSAYYLEGDLELPPGRVLAETEGPEFTPYAFFRLK
jgi:acetoacetate decarboxylase